MNTTTNTNNIPAGIYSGTWSGSTLSFTVTTASHDSLIEITTRVGIRGKASTVVTVTATMISWT